MKTITEFSSIHFKDLTIEQHVDGYCLVLLGDKQYRFCCLYSAKQAVVNYKKREKRVDGRPQYKQL
jgi:hypothetical protein